MEQQAFEAFRNFFKSAMYRSPNSKLVYIPVLKNASSYYDWVFSQANWTEIQYKDIHPDEDYLFGFISEPMTRYVKGVVQDMISHGSENILCNMLGVKFWEFAPILGIHSVPMTVIYPELYNKINWIPLDHRKINAKEVLQDILNTHGEQSVQLPQERMNSAAPWQKRLYDDIGPKFYGAGHTWFKILYPDEYPLYQKSIDQYLNN